MGQIINTEQTKVGFQERELKEIVCDSFKTITRTKSRKENFDNQEPKLISKSKSVTSAESLKIYQEFSSSLQPL